MAHQFTYHRSAERPSAKLWVFDDDGSLVDFDGYTFSFKIGTPGQTALLTKTSNITGATGAGTEPTGTPNIVIEWGAGELNIAPGVYAWQLTCTSSSADRVFEGSFKILETIT